MGPLPSIVHAHFKPNPTLSSTFESEMNDPPYLDKDGAKMDAPPYSGGLT